jgi:predicted dehydrogenase
VVQGDARRVLGANDRVVLASIGIRGQGNALKRGFAKLPDVEIKTLCDIDENLFASRASTRRSERRDLQARLRQDLRRVLDDKDVDGVIVATPNHWHALATIWALQAGKHVYVEKPASHTVWEGRQMIEATKRYGKIVQVGTMNRSRPPCARRSSSSTTAASARSTWRAGCASSRAPASRSTPTARSPTARLTA